MDSAAYGRVSLPNIVPFTYRDGMTFQHLLYEIRDEVTKKIPASLNAALLTAVEQVNAELGSMAQHIVESEHDAQNVYEQFVAQIERTIQSISNRVGPESIQRRTLTRDYTLTIDPVWPDAHPIRFQYTQDSAGGRSLTFGTGISAPGFQLSPEPFAVTEFTLVPDGNGAWNLDTTSLANVVPRALWVDPVKGNDSNSGIQTKPMKTVNAAIKVAESVAGKNSGFHLKMPETNTWVINLAAGTYMERVEAASFTPFNLNITIQGPMVPHPLVPKVIFTEGLGTVANGMKFNNPNAVIAVKYIKFIGYNGSSSACGINSSQGRLFTENVHVEDCFYGLSSLNGEIDIKGGIISYCGFLHSTGAGSGYGIRSLSLNHHSVGVQNAKTLEYGPIIKDCAAGFQAQESSTGHVDYTTFTGNTSAVVLRVSSRANLDGSSFENNSNGIQADTNSHAYTTDNTYFGEGSRANQRNFVLSSGSQTTGNVAIEGLNHSYGRNEMLLKANYKQQTVGLGRSNLLNYTLNRVWWNDVVYSTTPPKSLRIVAFGKIEGSAGTKSLIIRTAGSNTSYSASLKLGANETGDFRVEGKVIFNGETEQILTITSETHLGDSNRINTGRFTTNNAVNHQLTLETYLDAAGDSITVEAVELYIN